MYDFKISKRDKPKLRYKTTLQALDLTNKNSLIRAKNFLKILMIYQEILF